jgi:uncharacterized membrane protein
VVLDSVFNLEVVYVASGLALATVGMATWRDRGHPRRQGTGLFWLGLAVVFALGGALPSWLSGLIVVALALIDAGGAVVHGSYEEPPLEELCRRANELGLWLFVPVLLIPLLAFTTVRVVARLDSALDANAALFASLGFSSILAGAVAMWVTRGSPRELVLDTRRLTEVIGAAVILPQLLAALGDVFRTAGVGTLISVAVSSVFPATSILAAVFLCCATVVLLTFVMGNSFAAFPVVASGLAIPMLVTGFGVDPALVGALLLSAASTGTLCTPMAVNFNIVPAALLEMRDLYGVIRFQVPVAVSMFVIHVLLLWALAAWFRV